MVLGVDQKTLKVAGTTLKALPVDATRSSYRTLSETTPKIFSLPGTWSHGRLARKLARIRITFLDA